MEVGAAPPSFVWLNSSAKGTTEISLGFNGGGVMSPKPMSSHKNLNCCMPMSLDGLLEKHRVVGSIEEAIDPVKGSLNGANGRSTGPLRGVIWP